MKNRKLFFAALLLALSPTFLQAQAVQNDKAAAQDRTQTARVQEQLASDSRALSQLENLQARILEAYQISDISSVQAIKGDILEVMKQQLDQSEAVLATVSDKDRSQKAPILERQNQIHQELLTYEFTLDSKSKVKLNMIEEFILLMKK